MRVARAFSVLGYGVGFIAATVLGALIHVDRPAARRAIARLVDDSLAGTFKGRIDLEELGSVNPFRGSVGGVRATIYDAHGVPVVHGEGISARLDVLALLRSLTGKKPLRLALADVRAARVDATLCDDGTGLPTVAGAFDPKVPSPPDPNAQGVDLTVDGVWLGVAWAHGALANVAIDAEVANVDASFSMRGPTTRVDVRHLEVAARDLPGVGVHEVETSIAGSLTLPEKTDDLVARGEVHAVAGAVRVDARGSMDHQAIDATVDVPETPPEALRAVVRAAPLRAPVALTVRVGGKLPDLLIAGHVAVGTGTADLAGDAHLGEAIETKVRVVADRIPLAKLAEGVPEGTASLTLGAHATIEGRKIAGDYALATQATNVAGQTVPAVDASGTFTEASVAGAADVHEPGARVHVTYGLAPAVDDRTRYAAKAAVTVDIDALSRVPRLKGASLFGEVHGHAEGSAVLGGMAPPDVVASATFRGVNVGTDGVRAGSFVLDGKAVGSVRAPKLATMLTVQDLSAGGQRVKHLRVRASGDALAPFVQVHARPADGGDLVVRAPVDLRDGVSVRDLELRFEKKDERVEAKVARIAAKGSVVRVDDLKLTGTAGDLRASFEQNGSRMHVVAKSDALDLNHLAKLAGAADGDVRGTISLDADLEKRGDDATGTVNVIVAGLDAGELHDGHASLYAKLADRKATVQADAGIGASASVKVVAEQIALAGVALKSASWSKATGRAKVDANVDIAAVKDELPQYLPAAKASGTIALELTAARDDGKALPVVDASLRTHDVRVLYETNPPQAADVALSAPTVAEPPDRALRFGGADLDAKLHLDGEKGTTSLEATLAGRKGELVNAKVDTTLPVRELIAKPEEAMAKLRALPIEATVRLPRRAIQDLPSIGRPAGVRGDVELAVAFRGTMADPEVQVDAKGYQLAIEDSRVDAPVDVVTSFHFAKDKASLTAAASRDDVAVLEAKVDADVTLADFVDGAANPRWRADADVDLKGFPLPLLNALGTQPLAGCAFGTVKLRGLHDDAKVEAALWATNLQVGRTQFREARVSATADGTGVRGEARLIETDGSLVASGDAKGTWGAALAPKIDLKTPVAIDLEAKDFRLKPLAPFARPALSTFDGRLDASLHATVGEQGIASSKVEGKIQLRDGVVDARALGQELRQVKATVTIDPNGEVRVVDTSAHGVTGTVQVDAVAHLDGLALRDATGHLHIAKKDPFLVTLQGVDLGSAFGDVDLSAKTVKDVTSVDVNVKSFDFQLPDTASRSVQDLDAEPTIRVGAIDEAGVFHGTPFLGPDGQPATPAAEPPPPMTVADEADAKARAAKNPVAAELPPAPLRIDVKLGAVRVHQVGTIEAYPTGELVIAVPPSGAAIAGKIEVNRGYVEVQGRRFTIERAIASFDPKMAPSNPTVTAEALYTAADDTRVYAELIGTAKQGHLTLHSDPPLSQGEILSLVAFGSTDGVSSKPSNGQDESGVARAAGLGGGFVTQGLNKALTHISPVEITTRVDTTDSQDPRPEVGVQISQRVTATVSYALGLPTPGQAPDRTLLVLDYRFKPRWSLETTLGDHGTSIVDLLWKYRY